MNNPKFYILFAFCLTTFVGCSRKDKGKVDMKATPILPDNVVNSYNFMMKIRTNVEPWRADQEGFVEMLTEFSWKRPCLTRTSMTQQEIEDMITSTRNKIGKLEDYLTKKRDI